MIAILGEKLRQYELGRKVELCACAGAQMEKITFQRGGVTLRTAIKEEDGKTVAEIPNIFLKTYGTITVVWEGFDEEGYEKEERSTFCVHRREKPDDYVYVKTEVIEGGGGDLPIVVVTMKSMDEATFTPTMSHTGEEVQALLMEGKIVFSSIMGMPFIATGYGAETDEGFKAEFASVLDPTMKVRLGPNGEFTVVEE